MSLRDTVGVVNVAALVERSAAQVIPTRSYREVAAQRGAARWGALGLAYLSLVTLACLFSTAPAIGAESHLFLDEFTGADTPDGSLQNADRVAIRQSTGDVSVIDKGHGVVDTFDADGNYLSQIG